MGTIYLIRHGETAGNVNPTFRGKWDLPLNDHGLKQAEELAELLGRNPIRKIFTSPLQRAVQTAAPLARKRAIDSVPDPGFDDVDVGKWQGMEVAEVEKKFPGLFPIWRNSPEIFKFPGGGSLEELKQTAFQRLVEVARTHAAEQIAVVTHQVVNRVLLLTALGIGLEHYWKLGQETATVNVLEFVDDHFVLQAMNLGYVNHFTH